MPTRRGRKFITGTIDQYLVSLADGLRKAQEELSGLHVTRPGESPLSYHIPSLEFELKLAFEMSEEAEEEGPTPAMLRHTAGPERVERFAPALDIPFTVPPLRGELLNPETTSTETFQAEAASTIRGRFTAVPANGGAPLPVLSVSARAVDRDDAVEIVARVGNALGEALEGEEVEFNVDREYSNHLNWASVEAGELDEEDVELPAGTEIETAVATTDPDGEASSVLRVTGTAGQQVAIVVFAAGQSEVMVHEIPHG